MLIGTITKITKLWCNKTAKPNTYDKNKNRKGNQGNQFNNNNQNKNQTNNKVQIKNQKNKN